MRTIFLFLILSLFFSTSGFSLSTIKVELFSQLNLKTLTISPIEGKYELTTNNGESIKLKKNKVLLITLINDSISLWDMDKHLGVYKWVHMVGVSRTYAFKIEPSTPTLPSRYYEGNLIINSENKKLQVVNHVPIDSYLAGVVEAESGPKAPYEFYKSQAIISRTYLLELISKQDLINYHIGDDVNYQVYKGMSLQNPLIKQAVTHTNGLVIVDTSNNLITAAFHSNSGGQTANSEDVWLSETPYLKATSDPFSLDQKNTQWNDTILVSDWLLYLKKNGIDINTNAAKLDNLYFQQPNRQKYYMYNGDTIALRKIRSDFKLRSTWFSIKPEGNYLIISGKGYGHGVGLSQEGAMQMARNNYSFIDIINYYYKNIKVVNYNSIAQ